MPAANLKVRQDFICTFLYKNAMLRCLSSNMKRLFIISIGLIVVTVLLLSGWGYVSQRLFPERELARQTQTQMIFLAAAASEAHKWRLHGGWPESIQQLAAQPDGNMSVFLKLGTNDSWGHPIIFEPYSAARGYGRIISHGVNGTQDIILHYGDDQKMSFAKND